MVFFGSRLQRLMVRFVQSDRSPVVSTIGPCSARGQPACRDGHADLPDFAIAIKIM